MHPCCVGTPSHCCANLGDPQLGNGIEEVVSINENSNLFWNCKRTCRETESKSIKNMNKLLRIKGWSKANAFHVCITSYKLATQDIRAFKNKAWQYLILDEAQNIKNFRSQRWQMLLGLRSRRRLLLTGFIMGNVNLSFQLFQEPLYKILSWNFGHCCTF